MSDFNFLVSSSVVITISTAVVLAAYFVLSSRRKFDPVKALRLKTGVYQNRTTGNLINVRSFNGHIANVSDGGGVWSIRYDVLDSEYSFMSEL